MTASVGSSTASSAEGGFPRELRVGDQQPAPGEAVILVQPAHHSPRRA
jgi:hypothetical protein